MSRRVWWALARLVAVLSLLFAGGYLYGLQGAVFPFTSALFTAVAQAAGNTFTTPANFTISSLAANGTASGVDLTWAGVPWASGYNVYRSESAVEPPTPYTLTPVTTTAYTDSATALGTTYYYWVKALNSRNWLGPSVGPASGMASSDSVAPSVLSVSPSNGTVAVGTDTQVAVTFSEAMNTAATAAAITLVPCDDGTSACTTPGTGIVFATTTWNAESSAVQLAPTGSLATSTYYKLTVGTGARDASNNTLPAASQSVFRTATGADTVAPQVVPPTYPADGSVNVPTNVRVVIPFSEAMQQSYTEDAIAIVCASGQVGGCNPPSGTAQFSWNAAGTIVTMTPGELQQSKRYLLQITGSARDLVGNRLAGKTDSEVAYSAELFTTGTSADITQPRVITPTTPDSGVTAVPLNANIIVRFSEAMQQENSQAAISISCVSGFCTGPPTVTSNTWNTPGTSLTIGTMGLSPTSTYQVAVSSAAKDLVGLSLIPHNWQFTTSGSSDTGEPSTVTITSPTTVAYTAASTYTVSGQAPEQTLQVKIWRDSSANGTLEEADDPLVTTIQLYGSLQTFSVDVPLAPGQENRFIVTGSDLAGNQSDPVVLPSIWQGERRTIPGTVSLNPGNVSVNVYAPYSGDLSYGSYATGTALVEWNTANSFTTPLGSAAMTRLTDQYTYTIPTLSANTLYYVRVTYSDGDGVTPPASAQQVVSVTTLSGNKTGLITNLALSRERIASAAGHSTVVSYTTPDSADRTQVEIRSSSNVTVRNFGCAVTPASGGNVSYTWDGKNDSGQLVPDGVYNVLVTVAESASCSSNAQQEIGGTIVVSNVTSIGLSPSPAAITLGSGDYVIAVATVRNARNELVADGVPVSWTITGSQTTAGTENFSPVTATRYTGTSPGDCTVASGSGQACLKLTVGTAVVQTITLTASVASQDPNDGTVPVSAVTVSAATTVNDPPSSPTGLQLALGSVRIRWDALADPKVAGYRVYIGTASRRYTHTADVGPYTSYRFEDVTPGTRYYVTVRSYDKNGQLSPLGDEGSILVPAATPTPTVTRTVTPSVTSTGTATATATPTGTAAVGVTVTSTATATAAATAVTTTPVPIGGTPVAPLGGTPSPTIVSSPAATAPAGASVTSTAPAAVVSPSPTGATVAAAATGTPAGSASATPATPAPAATGASTVAPTAAPAQATLAATTAPATPAAPVPTPAPAAAPTSIPTTAPVPTVPPAATSAPAVTPAPAATSAPTVAPVSASPAATSPPAAVTPTP